MSQILDHSAKVGMIRSMNRIVAWQTDPLKHARLITKIGALDDDGHPVFSYTPPVPSFIYYDSPIAHIREINQQREVAGIDRIYNQLIRKYVNEILSN